MLTHGDQMLRDTARSAFWGSFNATPDLMGWLADRRDSKSDQETYSGFGFAPGVREMQGSRVKQSVPQYTYSLVNKQWESTVVIDYVTRKFNRNNDVQNLLSNMGKKSRAYPAKLGAAVLVANPNGYDGKALFSATHADPGGPYQTAQINGKSAPYTANWTTDGSPTDIEMAAAIRVCISGLLTYKDGFGDPFWPGETLDVIVMVPPQLYEIAHRVQVVDQLTGAVGNDLKGAFRLAVNPYLPWLAAAATFYVINGSAMDARPLVYQVAEDVSLDDDMGGDVDFSTKSVSFGTFAMYNVGVGNWRSIIEFIGT